RHAAPAASAICGRLGVKTSKAMVRKAWPPAASRDLTGLGRMVSSLAGRVIDGHPSTLQCAGKYWRPLVRLFSTTVAHRLTIPVGTSCARRNGIAMTHILRVDDDP